MNIFRLLLWPFRRPAPSVPPPTAVPPDLTLEQYQELDPVIVVDGGGQEVVYATPNIYTKFRVDTLHTKEPDTIAWIAGFGADEVFVDVGANMGIYTIWAAKTRGMRVFAFEPESQNYALLCKNIVLNGLSDRVTAYCLAISDENAFSRLYLSSFRAGESCHSFGEKVDFRLQQRDFTYSQGCVSATLDQLVAGGVMPAPQHIKVDVDGLEHKVINGARAVLQGTSVRSVLVEINTNLELHRNIISEMAAFGFRYSQAQVAVALRTAGAFAGVGNHVFSR
jgi:FkbM family methyltransferase